MVMMQEFHTKNYYWKWSALGGKQNQIFAIAWEYGGNIYVS